MIAAAKLQKISPPRQVRGFSLIELMIGMLLGLLVVGGAIAILLSNQRTYRATESLGRMQESARVAFELMVREVREAGGNPCGSDLPVANVLNNSSSQWWSNWGDGVVGYNNGSLAGSAAGTDAIQLMSAVSGAVTVVDHTKSSAQFKVNKNGGVEVSDIVLVCDYSQASIFQVTNANSSNNTIVHNTGNKVSPGNCTKSLGLPLPSKNCGGSGGNKGVWKLYGPNSILVQLEATRWFVADNGDGRSLYRVRMDKGEELARQEIVRNIQDMQIQYLLEGATTYVDANAALNWPAVTAVRIEMVVQDAESVGTDGQPLTRQLAHVVTLRNRVP